MLGKGIWRAGMLLAAFGFAGTLPAGAEVRSADPLSKYVKAASWVSSKDGPVYVELLSDGTAAALRIRSSSEPEPSIRQLGSPADVLALLADKHMSFLWQPLVEWAGPTLDAFRTKSLARLRESAASGKSTFDPTDTGQSTVRAPVRAVLQLADLLEQTGQGDEAISLLQQQLAKMPKKAQGWGGIEWFEIASGEAKVRWHSGDFAGAIADYAAIEQGLSGSPFALNATVNRAALLAESGHYDEALATINAAWDQYLVQTQGDRIPGSERQFAWIRACALEGLGRTDEAQAEMHVFIPDREPKDPDFILPKDNALQMRAAVCMNDVELATKIIRRGLEGTAVEPDGVLWMQPAFVSRLPPWQAMLAKVRADPTVQKAVEERMRVLPPELTPALNAWMRGPAAPSSQALSAN